MKTQLKFVVDRSLAERFKQAVLRRRGKLDLSREAEEALQLYLRERDVPAASSVDPLLSVIGIAKSRGTPRASALEDKRRLYDEG